MTAGLGIGADRPRCRATGADGQRCREPVVWDPAANRPVSTRCEVHGGLADADLIRRQAADPEAMPHKLRAAARGGDSLASALNALRTQRLG